MHLCTDIRGLLQYSIGLRTVISRTVADLWDHISLRFFSWIDSITGDAPTKFQRYCRILRIKYFARPYGKTYQAILEWFWFDVTVRIYHMQNTWVECFFIVITVNDLVTMYSILYYHHTSDMISFTCSWSIVCWGCSSFILILHLTPGFNGSGDYY